MFAHTLVLNLYGQFLEGTSSIWELTKQIVLKQVLLGNPTPPNSKHVYTKLRHTWFGYLSLVLIDFPRLMTCPEECTYLQADGTTLATSKYAIVPNENMDPRTQHRHGPIVEKPALIPQIFVNNKHLRQDLLKYSGVQCRI